jgi:hypothetical protein
MAYITRQVVPLFEKNAMINVLVGRHVLLK